MQEKKKVTPLSDLGKPRLIDHITAKTSINNKSTVVGVGDDAAVLNHSGHHAVVSTNMMCEGVHFDLTYNPLKHLGYKAVIIAISNIYAMNAVPTNITVSLGLSSKYSVEAIDELYEGILQACEIYKLDLVGGDLKSSLTGMSINITAIGKVKKDAFVCRNKAAEGDIICVTGDIGGAYAGLQLLEREKKVFDEDKTTQPELSGYDYILERQLKPEARKELIDILKEENIIPTAMLSVSSGLASEVLHLCKSSDAGCILYHNHIPIAEETIKLAEKFGIDPLTIALNGGEDHEILFTIKKEELDKIEQHKLIKQIGMVKAKEEGKYLLASMDKKIPLTAQGWA